MFKNKLEKINLKKSNTLRQLLICIISVVSFKSSAQITQVVGGLSGPYGLALYGNNLYISQSGEINGNKISKIDLTSSNPIVNNVFTNNLAFPTKLKIHENYLYVTESDAIDGEISRALLIGGSNPVMESFITSEVTAPIAIEIKNNILYVADFDNSNIIKINTATTPFQTSILVNDPATDIIVEGDNIYYANPFSGMIYSNSLSNPTTSFDEISTGIVNPSSLLIYGGMMYVSDYFNGKVYRFNYQNTTINTQLLASGLNFPQSMVAYNNELYIAEMGANRIVKLNLANLITETFENTFSAIIYPNPLQNLLSIHTVETIKDVSVIDLLGKKIPIKQIANNSFDISLIAKGTYIIIVTSANDKIFSSKFIKQ